MKIPLTRRQALPLGSVVVAGALAAAVALAGSDASAASDGVRLTAADGGAALVVTALEPGDSVTRTVTIENTTGAEGRLTFTERGGPASYADGALQVVISRADQQVYAGAFGAMGDYAQDMGFLADGERVTFSFTVSLPDDAVFVPPGTETAEASYSWVTESR